MKLRGKVLNVSYSESGKPNILIEAERELDVNKIKDIERESFYSIKFSNSKQRSNPQNSLMWAVIADIDTEYNGRPTEQGREEIYLEGIRDTAIDYIDIPLEQMNNFKNSNEYRTYRVYRQSNEDVFFRWYKGSSTFDTKEMGILIDHFLDIASELDIPLIDYRAEYEELFNAR